MNISSNGINLIKKWESFKPKPYLCSAGVPTIGIGTTKYPNGIKVTLNDSPISEELAVTYLIDHIKTIEIYLQPLRLTQNQYDALISFVYNCGIGNFNSSTLLKKVKVNPDDQTISNEFRKWNKAGGKTSTGLSNRREDELKLYFKK